MTKIFIGLFIILAFVTQGWGATCTSAADWAVLNDYGDTSGTVSGSVSSGNDDYYKVILNLDGKIDISFAADQKTNFYLMNSSCSSVASKTNTKSGTLSYTANAGTYYFKISRNGNSNYTNVKATLSFPDENWKDFELLKQYNILGDIKAIGNSVLCKSSNGSSSGTCIAPGATEANNAFYAIYSDVDGDGSTTNSTSANLTIPSGATVRWAGLFWNGRLGSGKTTSEKLAAKNIKLKFPGASSYTTITADAFNWATSDFAYKGYKDITTLMNLSSPNGTYYVSDIKTALGKNAFGAWSLFVIYESSADKFKNISVYDGFFSMQSSTNAALGQFQTKTTDIAGFLTPTSGLVNSKLLLFSSEGDIAYKGEQLSMSDKSGAFTTISNALNPADNVFNSTITENGVSFTDRNPSYLNTVGIDLDTFDVSSIMQNSQTSTTIRFYSNQDQYFPNALAFSTELYLPDVCYEEEITKNGQPLNGVYIGDTLDINVTVTNKNPETAKKVVITKTFNDYLGYVPETTAIKSSTDSSFIPKTDAAGDDTASYDPDAQKLTLNLGTGATATQGGIIAQNQAEAFKSKIKLLKEGDMTSDYRVTFMDLNGIKEYTDIAIAKCSKLDPTVISILPSGKVRIVEPGKNWGDFGGALFTKVAGATYNYDLLFATNETGSTLTTGKIQRLELWNVLTNQLVSTPINTLTQINSRLTVTVPLPSSYQRLQFKIVLEDNSIATSNDFSVRPASFAGSINGAKAGETKELSDGSIKANGFDNNPSSGYNASINTANIKALTFAPGKVCDSDQQAEMIGSFSIAFTDGSSSNGSINFLDVGDINITLLDSSWTAKSDDLTSGHCIQGSASNVPDADGKVGCNVEGDVAAKISPYQFVVTAGLGGGDWKYMADSISDQNTTYSGIMTAQNMSSGTTLNFSKDCYAADVPTEFNFTLDQTSDIYYSVYSGGVSVAPAAKINVAAGNKKLQFTLSSDRFLKGIANFNVDLGMDKNYAVPKNPARLSAKDFTPASATTNISYFFPANTNTDFVYGRARPYDITTNEASAPNPVEFEVYSTTSSGYVSGMPQNVLHWYRNTNHNSGGAGNIIRGGFAAGATDAAVSTLSAPQNGVQIVTVTSSVDRTVHLDISKWLWYSPKNSYNYNGTCSQHPCFIYDYTGVSGGVQGVSTGNFQGSDFQMAPAQNITNKGVKLFR